MPLYEYVCKKCGAEFEELTRSSNSGEAVACRACGSRSVTRLLSAFAVHASAGSSAPEPGPCGACGARQRGICGVE